MLEACSKGIDYGMMGLSAIATIVVGFIIFLLFLKAIEIILNEFS